MHHAPRFIRTQNLVNAQGINRDTAEKLVLKSDSQQRGFFRYAFNLNLFDPSLYDLVINTRKMEIAAAVRLITEAADSDEIKTCSLEAVETMKKRSLEKRLRASLLDQNIDVSLLHIEVPELNIADVWGFAPTQEEKDRILKTLEDLPELTTLRSEITITPSAGE